MAIIWLGPHLRRLSSVMNRDAASTCLLPVFCHISPDNKCGFLKIWIRDYISVSVIRIWYLHAQKQNTENPPKQTGKTELLKFIEHIHCYDCSRAGCGAVLWPLLRTLPLLSGSNAVYKRRKQQEEVFRMWMFPLIHRAPSVNSSFADKDKRWVGK